MEFNSVTNKYCLFLLTVLVRWTNFACNWISYRRFSFDGFGLVPSVPLIYDRGFSFLNWCLIKGSSLSPSPARSVDEEEVPRITPLLLSDYVQSSSFFCQTQIISLSPASGENKRKELARKYAKFNKVNHLRTDIVSESWRHSVMMSDRTDFTQEE